MMFLILYLLLSSKMYLESFKVIYIVSFFIFLMPNIVPYRTY